VAYRESARLLLLGYTLKARAKGRGHAKVFMAFFILAHEIKMNYK
jgi:hypothetical protein